MNSATFRDCLRLANVVLLPRIVRFGEMNIILCDQITGVKDA